MLAQGRVRTWLKGPGQPTDVQLPLFTFCLLGPKQAALCALPAPGTPRSPLPPPSPSSVPPQPMAAGHRAGDQHSRFFSCCDSVSREEGYWGLKYFKGKERRHRSAPHSVPPLEALSPTHDPQTVASERRQVPLCSFVPEPVTPESHREATSQEGCARQQPLLGSSRAGPCRGSQAQVGDGPSRTGGSEQAFTAQSGPPGGMGPQQGPHPAPSGHAPKPEAMAKAPTAPVPGPRDHRALWWPQGQPGQAAGESPLMGGGGTPGVPTDRQAVRVPADREGEGHSPKPDGPAGAVPGALQDQPELISWSFVVEGHE
ncbi:proline-rich proteoglycan 2-like [Moschus berezovskii]|uniref:proline-rich proteoglycan 2-like n=1 Tax=Moschus berezovskii TaxID=68408 RepID=UPI002444E788|nr:proline-rich proteoglycan 2-like [Moschus berezovskii]